MHVDGHSLRLAKEENRRFFLSFIDGALTIFWGCDFFFVWQEGGKIGGLVCSSFLKVK